MEQSAGVSGQVIAPSAPAGAAPLPTTAPAESVPVAPSVPEAPIPQPVPTPQPLPALATTPIAPAVPTAVQNPAPAALPMTPLVPRKADTRYKKYVNVIVAIFGMIFLLIVLIFLVWPALSMTQK